MKQGDVISPLFFKAGLGHALRKWKQKLKHHGFLDGARERLTNIRFADDLMLYAKTLHELVEMLELLVLDLSSIEIHLNVSKTNILTNTNFIDILKGEEQHKYWGRV